MPTPRVVSVQGNRVQGTTGPGPAGLAGPGRAGARTAGRLAPAAGRRAFGLVDELNCYFDSSAEPNNVHVEFWLPGHLDPERLRTAVAAVLARQPRAAARRAASGGWRRGYAWEFPAQPDVDPVSAADWQAEPDLDLIRARFLAAAPPLDRAPPFRLLLARGPGRDSLILNAHHAAFDGRSCLRLLRLVADEYGAGPAGQATAADGSAPAAADQSSPLPWPGSPWPRLRVRRAARVAPRHAGRRRDRRAPGYGYALLGWPGVPSAARAGPRLTVNDVLIAALVEAIQRWNKAAGRPARRVRISMPVDARPPGREDELGNLTRLCTVSTDLRGSGHPGAGPDLTAVVAGQTKRAKDQPGPPVGPGLIAAARVPLPAPVKRRLVRLAVRGLGWLECDTSLLSNLGSVADAPRFGTLVPERMWFSTSAHMPRGLSVGAATVNGRLQLCFRYRHALFDEAAARDFAAGYAAALAELTGSQ
jgi:NRPS condensation-like uncharacterized protein